MASMSQYALTGKTIRQLMRSHHVTIRQLANGFGLTMKRIREVRANGACGFLACNWHYMITGVWLDLPTREVQPNVRTSEAVVGN